MKGVNWGRTLARVLSILLVLRASAVMVYAFGLYLREPELYREIVDIRMTSIGLVVVYLVLALLLWLRADRFSPSSEESVEEHRDSVAIVTVLIAAVGAYFFFQQGNMALAQGLSYVFDTTDSRRQAQMPDFAFNLFASAVCATVVFKSKSLANWIGK